MMAAIVLVFSQPLSGVVVNTYLAPEDKDDPRHDEDLREPLVRRQGRGEWGTDEQDQTQADNC